MNVTWSIQTWRKNRVHSASAPSLKVPTPVEVIPARLVAVGQQLLVLIRAAGEPPRDRPDGAGVQNIEQHRVGHKPRDAPVAIQERVNPEQPVMRRRRREDRIGLAKIAIDALEEFQETGHRTGADGKMPPDLDITAAQFAGDDAKPLFRCAGLPRTAVPPGATHRTGRAPREVPSTLTARSFSPPSSIHF